MNRIAYASEKVSFSEVLSNPLWKTLLEPGGPWAYSSEIVEGKKCTVVMQIVDENKVVNLSKVKPPVKITDDLYYFAPLELPTSEELARVEIPHETRDYLTSTGVTLSIPTYRCVPRALNSRSITGKAKGTFANRCESIFKKLEKKEDVSDSEILQLVYGAIQECYRVTDDLLDQLEWVTTKDVDPILEIILGIDPKSQPNGKEK